MGESCGEDRVDHARSHGTHIGVYFSRFLHVDNIDLLPEYDTVNVGRRPKKEDGEPILELGIDLAMR
jgi:hypothetical protein